MQVQNQDKRQSKGQKKTMEEERWKRKSEDTDTEGEKEPQQKRSSRRGQLPVLNTTTHAI